MHLSIQAISGILTAPGLLGITFYNIFFMVGLKYTTVAKAALLISLSPLFGATIQVVSGKEKLTLRVNSGLGLAAAGAPTAHSPGPPFSRSFPVFLTARIPLRHAG
jgi:drug/metabolite transporter (DMT)-like permease